MPATNLGKKFEETFKSDWRKSFPNTFLWRIPDQQNGYLGSKNFSDFLAFHNDFLWLLECKETKEGTINFSKISQLDVMKDYLVYNSVLGYIIIWYSKFDKILAVSCQEALRIRDELKMKSISLKMLENKSYNIIEIPAVKKRVFLTADYTKLLEKVKEEQNKNE